MFSNFVIFTEVVKLSSNVFWKMREVNCHDKVLDLIYEKQDVVTFEEVIDLVNNKYLITKFIGILNFCETRTGEKWLKSIFEAIDHIDITAFDNTLLTYSSKNGFVDFVKYLVRRPDCKVCRQRCCHVLLYIIKTIMYYFKL